MSTSAAPIAANTINPPFSAEARTEAGHAGFSPNATVHPQPVASSSAPTGHCQTEPSVKGFFAQRDFIRPGEEEAYAKAKAGINIELAPAGLLECTLVDEIHRAMWRLRRCGQVEANLIVRLEDGRGHIFDPMETANAANEKIQRTVDQARSQAHRLLHKCTAELRKLQTERHYRNESLAALTEISGLGICDVQSLHKALERQSMAARVGRLT